MPSELEADEQTPAARQSKSGEQHARQRATHQPPRHAHCRAFQGLFPPEPMQGRRGAVIPGTVTVSIREAGNNGPGSNRSTAIPDRWISRA